MTYDYVNLTPKCATCFSTDPLDLYNFDSACPDVSKYLTGQALRQFNFGEEYF